MRTTITLDDDVVAIVEHERARTGESFRATVNRLLRRSAPAGQGTERKPLPTLPGRPSVDVTDASAVLAALDDERRAERALA